MNGKQQLQVGIQEMTVQFVMENLYYWGIMT